MEHAVSQAVDECVSNDVLTDILTAQKTEVIQVVLETFDQEKFNLSEDEVMERLKAFH